MAGEHREQLAGHEADEADDPAILDQDPLAVGAGVADHPAPGAAVRIQFQPAEHLGLLAPHHIDGAGEARSAHAGHDPGRSVRVPDKLQTGGERVRIRRTVHVVDRAPANGRADSAAEDRRQPLSPHGRANLPLEHVPGLTRLQSQYALVKGPRREHRTVRAQHPGPQTRVAPVASQQHSFGHRRHVLPK